MTPELIELADILAAPFFLPGYDHDDVRQEARIGLWVATRQYDPTLGVPFRAFATLVIRRRLYTAIRLASGQKHEALNSSLRHARDDDGMPTQIIDMVADPLGDPADLFIERERFDEICATVSSLSPLEREAIWFAINGYQYKGNELHSKRIDNALQRARRKLRAVAC